MDQVAHVLCGAPPCRASFSALTSGTSRHSRHTRSWDSHRQACHILDRSRSDFPTHLGSEGFVFVFVFWGEGQRWNGEKEPKREQDENDYLTHRQV